jgi:hypothetical protein
MRLARLLQAMLAALLLAAGAWAAYWLQHGRPLWALGGALAIVFVHVPVMALEFLLLRTVNRADPAPRPTASELLRAWAGEAVGAVLLFGWRQPFGWRRFDDHLPADAAGRRGLLLVHGFVCNRGLWNPWWPRLRAAGVPCIALNLEPVFGSIDDYAELVEAAVRRLSECTGQPPLLVGHSMGGLALRAWLRSYDGATRMHGAVTIGSPHHGTWLGRFGAAPNALQMCAGSRWLRGLAADEPGETLYREFTCFYSHTDNIVFPCSTATLPGADNRHLRAQAHVHLLQHPAVFDAVIQRLRGDGAGPQATAETRATGGASTLSGRPQASA